MLTGRSRRAALLVLAVAAAACSGGVGPLTTPPPSTGSPPTSAGSPMSGAFDPSRVSLALENLAGGLDGPLAVTGAGDGSGRLFVAEQTGRIRVIRDGELLPDPFLDLSERVVVTSEQGLLGLAFHPDYAENGRFFVYYSAPGSEQRVAEFSVSADDPDRADPGSERILLPMADQAENHNGGCILFGPDGYLWIATGDGGEQGDPEGDAQDRGSLLGKLLRMDVDGGDPYRIPPDNPFVDTAGARPEVWAYGLRNPWRFSIDRETGDVWIGDVGGSAYEEVNRAPGGRAGLNFGWVVTEGPECYGGGTDCDRSGLVPPVWSYPTGCCVTGGFVYRGSDFPVLAGGYLVGDYATGQIWSLDPAGPDTQEGVELLDSDLSISSFGEDDDGELYVTDIGGGGLYRITATRA
ncbi:MAG TPA: PQQ-dependent sugar dehydrogenase [Actinomycetota bacterium]|nr:PQQ-dependent sugar dehydrogenase [Actinomycetota bacterium]